MSSFLGMEINQTSSGIFVNQRRYAADVLKRFGMDKCKPVNTPLVATQKLSKEDGAVKVDESLYRSLIGCLLYLTTTRPDLMSRFMTNPSENHFRAAKRVLRYIKGNPGLGVWFRKSESFQLVGYSDSDWAGSIDDMKSTSGYVFFLNSGAVCWLSKRQATIAQSTGKAEYISTVAIVNQAIWLRKILNVTKLRDSLL
ncbi:secreted RxLR effector protein 161-like [Pistacia vera]|uniref:secreted RxLR effector protein 161-like n=1 Tax=Pistacia vera TaxID=55513 RepID=UPI0012636D67|nr:secreted RxLR effector protein 161-like [Pistacia vera]